MFSLLIYSAGTEEFPGSIPNTSLAGQALFDTCQTDPSFSYRLVPLSCKKGRTAQNPQNVARNKLARAHLHGFFGGTFR
jgi:hypothetical protein